MRTRSHARFRFAHPALTAALLCAVGLMTSCASSDVKPESAPAPVVIDHTPTLLNWMKGSFNSAKQAAADPTYFDIHLHIVPCWTDRTDGPWLYVEQARGDTLSQPYRQRVYRLSRIDERTYKSEVFEFDGDPLRFAGAWNTPAPLADISPANLKLKDGCEVILTWTPDKSAFIGGTQGKGCPSALRGAAYATSEVTLSKDGMHTWDRGYDASDQQVWGAIKGGYQFDKVAK